MDFDDERVKKIARQYQERLIYCEPSNEDYGKETVPIGIDLSGSILTEKNQAYTEDVALGIEALASRIDQIEIFLAYLFEKQ